ncbi:aminotransferase class IV [Saprospiraceae bacterium]|nr:aminotransferase class IV [Saprospiraceae bacterium]
MNLSGHQERVDRCLKSYNSEGNLSLLKLIDRSIIPPKGVYKLRIQYDADKIAITNVKCHAYKEKAINSLSLAHVRSIEYIHKSEDRTVLDLAYAQRGKSDDVIIVNNGKLTDTWYCNIALFDGQKWFTPKFCLLPGTMRKRLIEKDILEERDIQFTDLQDYQKVRLFNAMIPWSRKKDIDLKDCFIKNEHH